MSLCAINWFSNVVNACMVFYSSCITLFRSLFVVPLFCTEMFTPFFGVSEDELSFLWSIRNLQSDGILGGDGVAWLFCCELISVAEVLHYFGCLSDGLILKLKFAFLFFVSFFFFFHSFKVSFIFVFCCLSFFYIRLFFS